MKKKVLLCINTNQFVPYDYTIDYASAAKKQGANSGNNVFEYAIQKMLLCPEVEVEYNFDFFHNRDTFEKNIPEINEKFECVIILPANIFAPYAMKFFVPDFIRMIHKLKIPVYVIGAGAQSDIDYSFDFLKKWEKLALDFVNAVAETNGKFGLRGYFTAECFKKLNICEDLYEVIGCPSLFQNGRDLKVNVASVKQLKIAFNGNRMLRKSLYHSYFDTYKDSIFVCQDELYKFLYRPQEMKIKDLKNVKCDHIVKLLKEGRVRLYCNYQSWVNDLKNLNINFSYGTRIHGNIVPILSGIPAVVEAVDSRTRELSEYFEIPCVFNSDKIQDLEDLYSRLDYGKFNQNFVKKFDKFKKFMHGCGLPCWEDAAYIHKNVPDFKNFPAPKPIFRNLNFVQKVCRHLVSLFWAFCLV